MNWWIEAKKNIAIVHRLLTLVLYSGSGGKTNPSEWGSRLAGEKPCRFCPHGESLFDGCCKRSSVYSVRYPAVGRNPTSRDGSQKFYAKFLAQNGGHGRGVLRWRGEGSALWLDREGPRRANYAQNSSKQKINIFILFTIKFYEQIFSPILFRAFAYLITFVCASATSYQRNSAYDV